MISKLISKLWIHTFFSKVYNFLGNLPLFSSLDLSNYSILIFAVFVMHHGSIYSSFDQFVFYLGEWLELCIYECWWNVKHNMRKNIKKFPSPCKGLIIYMPEIWIIISVTHFVFLSLIINLIEKLWILTLFSKVYNSLGNFPLFSCLVSPTIVS